MEPYKSVRKRQSIEKWAKRLNKHLRKKDIQMANIINQKKQIKNTMRHHITFIRLTKSHNS